MTTTATQQVVLDNALVPLENRVEIGKFNLRIDLVKTQKEPTYHFFLDALALTTFYPAFLITADKNTPAKAERSKGIDLQSEAALLEESQPKGKSVDTHEGTCLKPGVLDVSIVDSSESKNESWGDSGYETNVQSDDKDVLKSDDYLEQADDEWTEFDNPRTNVEEYERINEELYGDVNVRLTDDEPADAEKDDEEMTVAGHVNVNQKGAVQGLLVISFKLEDQSRKSANSKVARDEAVTIHFIYIAINFPITVQVIEQYMARSGMDSKMAKTGYHSHYTVMSDSVDSTVTYTEVSSLFADLSDIGSPGVDGPLVMPEDPYACVVAAFQAPPSPNYVPGLEEPEQAPPLPVYVPYVPEPVYPKFMPPKDEVLPAEEQPLPAAASPTVDSPGYVPKSDPEEDPEEDDEEDPEGDPADYPADGGDDDDDEDESSDDDEDDDVDIEGDEEHPAPADSTAVALPTVDQAPSTEETKSFETDKSAATPPPHPAYHVTARMSIRDEPPTPFWFEAEVARLLAIPSPPPSPLSLWSSPLPQIPSQPLPVLPPPLHVSPTYPLGYISYSPIPEQIHYHHVPHHRGHHHSYPYCYLLHHHLYRYPLLTMEQTCLRFAYHFRRGYVLLLVLGVGYGITDTWDEMLVDMLGAPATDDTELGQWITKFDTKVRQDINEIYMRDRRAHAHTALLAMDASDLARSEVMSLCTTVLGQQVVITELQAVDHKRQAAITELLAADRRRQAQFIKALKLLKRLQTQMTEFESQQGPAKCPAQPDAPEEAGSSS
ncbi:hypothetical protein Tco_0347511 [Tanacetum coccineum]